MLLAPAYRVAVVVVVVVVVAVLLTLAMGDWSYDLWDFRKFPHTFKTGLHAGLLVE